MGVLFNKFNNDYANLQNIWSGPALTFNNRTYSTLLHILLDYDVTYSTRDLQTAIGRFGVDVTDWNLTITQLSYM